MCRGMPKKPVPSVMHKGGRPAERGLPSPQIIRTPIQPGRRRNRAEGEDGGEKTAGGEAFFLLAAALRIPPLLLRLPSSAHRRRSQEGVPGRGLSVPRPLLEVGNRLVLLLLLGTLDLRRAPQRLLAVLALLACDELVDAFFRRPSAWCEGNTHAAAWRPSRSWWRGRRG